MKDVDNKVKMVVEGLLLAAGRPLTLDNIIQVFSDDEKPDRDELKIVMQSIADECNDRGFELKEVASGYRFQVKQDLSEWVAKLWEERPPRYTRALLETLALIAYRQPITRGDIEEIRGVGVSSNIIRTLLDREWVRVVGHRDVPGRPAMFATTKGFLDYFNLKNLQDLPALSEIKELEQKEPELDLEDDLADRRVLELPEEVMDEGSLELSESEQAEMIAEEEAVALSKKPLDEILGLPSEQEKAEAEAAEAEAVEAAEAADDAEIEAPEAADDSEELVANDDEAALDVILELESGAMDSPDAEEGELDDNAIDSADSEFTIADDSEEATDEP